MGAYLTAGQLGACSGISPMVLQREVKRAMVEKIMKEIRQRCHPIPSQNQSLKEWKEQGKKAVGYLCLNVPEEIMYASGILPVRILGSTENALRALEYLPGFTCYFARSCLEMGLVDEYKVLDGIVITRCCDTGLLLSHVIEKRVKLLYHYLLVRPLHAQAEGAYEFFRQEISRFETSLEHIALFSGEKIGRQSLVNAIQIYNKNRTLLKEIYDLRGKGESPLLSGLEVAEITRSSMLMPKEESNEILAEVVQAASHRKDPPPANCLRLHVSGSVLPDLQLFELIESCGGMVVSDDLCVGSRYFWQSVDANAPPLESLTRYYLEKIPCPAMFHDGVLEERLNYVREMVRRYRADGVIFSLQKFCEPHQLHHPYLVEKLRQEGTPVLSLEVEQSIEVARVRTMLEAFFEQIRGTRE